MSISFNYNGADYTMSQEEIMAAFWYCDHQYKILDAKRHYEDFIHSENYTGDVPKYVTMSLLEAFVSKYECFADCNVPENDTWEIAISQVLSEKFAEKQLCMQKEQL